MEKEFIPYELAVKLKELGFKEPCFYYYKNSDNCQLWQSLEGSYYRNGLIDRGKLLWGETYDNGNVSAPLWQQAFDWLDREFGLFVSFDKIDNTRNFYYDFTIIDSKNRDYDDEDLIDSASRNLDKGKFETYEEVRQACLEKLIEIARKNIVTKPITSDLAFDLDKFVPNNLK